MKKRQTVSEEGNHALIKLLFGKQSKESLKLICGQRSSAGEEQPVFIDGDPLIPNYPEKSALTNFIDSKATIKVFKNWSR